MGVDLLCAQGISFFIDLHMQSLWLTWQKSDMEDTNVNRLRADILILPAKS
jgi:hypothetical protein